VGPSKHSCHMIVIYWFDDDYMFQPCLAIFRS